MHTDQKCQNSLLSYYLKSKKDSIDIKNPPLEHRKAMWSELPSPMNIGCGHLN